MDPVEIQLNKIAWYRYLPKHKHYCICCNKIINRSYLKQHKTTQKWEHNYWKIVDSLDMINNGTIETDKLLEYLNLS
jgi:hypothetical protein